MSTLFAMSQGALLGRDLSPAPSETTSPESSTVGAPATDTTAAKTEWSVPGAGASPLTPVRWRINSGDLEEMMHILSSAGGTAAAGAPTAQLEELPHWDNPIGKEASPPLSRDDLGEDRETVVGFPTTASSSSASRGSSPLYRKHATDYHLEHHLDATAPSSPCTPSMHMRSLSAVSPTSSRSDEAAFQHQLSPEGDSRMSGGGAAPVGAVSRPAANATSGQQQQSGGVGGNNSGRFGLKLLVSNSMAGTLIGKGGTRICEIKDECLADIKVTPNGRFYPGTHERVVLVVGEPRSVQMACDRIVTTIYTAADTSLDITQRVLIPDAASGLIIGQEGVRLGELRQDAGVASIQVSPRDMCTVAGERVVTLQGPMSAVIHGLTLIVDRMMEDTTASRYQNMSTIYRAVHLHLPPYAVPGMHDGSSPRHPRLSPSYGGPSPHSQHDFHSPGAVAARGGGGGAGGGREYGGGVNGPPHWEFGYNGSSARDLAAAPHGGGGGGGTPVEFVHRAMSMPVVRGQEIGSPRHHRATTAPAPGGPAAAHFGGRHLRDFDFSEADVRGGRCGNDLDDMRREYDSPSPADLSRPGSRESNYLHHSPRLPGPSPRDYDHMRQQGQQHASESNRGFGAGRGGYPGPAGPASQQSDFLPIQQQQQQRLRQQQQQQMARPSQDYSQEAGMLIHEARAAAAAASSAQHRGMHDGGSSAQLHRTCSVAVHNTSGGAGTAAGGGVMGSPPHGGELRRCHTSGAHGDASALSGMFDGMSLNSPHGMAPPPPPQQSSSTTAGLMQQQQQQQGGPGIIHGELPVPDADVGIILGKGGATVRELQQLSGAKIMIARRNEFMPGTKHRLVTLAGPPLAVNMARFLIMRKIQTEKEKL